jgi:hypothetical protein
VTRIALFLPIRHKIALAYLATSQHDKASNEFTKAKRRAESAAQLLCFKQRGVRVELPWRPS